MQQINISNFPNFKGSTMPSFRSENLTIEINLSEGKFMDLIRVSKDRYLDVRVEALEVD